MIVKFKIKEMETKGTVGKMGRMTSCFFGALFLVTLTILVVSFTKQYLENMQVNEFRHQHLDLGHDFRKMPRLSADKKTLVVTSEDALPNAFEFLRLNMYLPIQKIVLMKPGQNDTVRVYPIPRDGMIGLGGSLSLSVSEIGLILLFLIFIIGSFTYIFTSISNTRVYWDEEGSGWLNNDDLCFDPNDLYCDDEIEEEKLLIKADKKRKEIETI